MQYPLPRSGSLHWDTNQSSDLTGLLCEDDSLTQQQFSEESDINNIVRQFGLTGKLPDNVRMPIYADFDEIYDFHTAQNVIRQAGEQFLRLPPETRARFHHDPQELLVFLNDASNRSEAVQLGLVPAPPPPPLQEEKTGA